MKHLFLTILSFSTLSLFAQTNPLRTKIAAAADQLEAKVISIRRDIHEHPELGNREVRTAALVAKALQELNIEVQTGVAHTGVVGILKGGKPGPVVALRADMDALPVTETAPVPFASKVRAVYNNKEGGVMHACGHDSHVAMLLGVAEILSGLRKELKGTVKFIFQPAEEGLPKGEDGGAELMVKEGVLENPHVDAVFGLHVQAQTEVGIITYRPGGFYAGANDFKIIVKGRSSHGAYPWLSVDPIVTSAQIITNLQTIVSRNLNISENAGVVTVGAINGGNRNNIIPEQVEMIGTVRSLSPADEKLMVERVKQVVTKTAEAAGATADITIPYETHYPVTVNDVALTEKMLPSLQQTAGKDKVKLTPPHTGAEDFSFYGQKIPALFINLGCMPKGGDPLKAAPHHTPNFFVDESCFKLGMQAMANLAVDYMEMKK